MSQTKWVVHSEVVGGALTLVHDSAATRYEYDPKFHHVTKITAPDGQVTRIFYTGPYRDSVQVADTTVAVFEYMNRLIGVRPEGLKSLRVQDPVDTSIVRRGLLKYVHERGKSYPFEVIYGDYGNVAAVITPAWRRTAIRRC
jgi:YD repeat-containing protein